jgi:hypothetical protein
MENQLNSTITTMASNIDTISCTDNMTRIKGTKPKTRIIRVKKRQSIKPDLDTKPQHKPKPKTRIIRVRKQTNPISSTLKKETAQIQGAKRNVVTETTTRMRCDTDNVSSIERDYLDAMDDKQRQVYEIAKDHLGSSFHLRKSIGFQQYLEKKNSLKCK